MGIGQAVLLGALQGLTEFLPVSSSGHLLLLQRLFGISEGALFFDTLVHAGTLLAVVVVLRRDIWRLLRRPLQPLTLFLILGTLPAVLAALFFKDTLEAALSGGAFLGISFLVTAALLTAAELLYRRNSAAPPRAESAMNAGSALFIGALQAVAILPGISRSGATLAGALACRLDRDFAARFSFLLSIPAILGALVLQAGGLFGSGPSPEVSTAACAAGFISAAVVGFFSIRLMLSLVRRHALWGFAVYTGLLGAFLLLGTR
jgi:undecaprenyl-diphosphatase